MGRHRRQRRSWSDDEKRRIVAQTKVLGVSVSEVARRYDVNANQVFNWLRDPRFQPSEAAGEAAKFLPVQVIAEGFPAGPERRGDYGSIEIDLANGHRLRVNGAFDPDAAALLARTLGT